MHIEVKHKWRFLWLGKWRTTRFHATEEHIRREHPEAVCVPGTMIEQEVLDTDEEHMAALRERASAGHGGVLRNARMPPHLKNRPPALDQQ